MEANMAKQKPSFDNKSTNMFADTLHAVMYLQEHGIVDNASQTWNMAKLVKGADQIFINMANYIANTVK